MTLRKRLPALLLAVVLAVSLSGCAIPIPGFADYDVSGYVKALLDSSYHQENEEFMSITGATKTAAQQNNTDTVENAAAYTPMKNSCRNCRRLCARCIGRPSIP